MQRIKRNSINTLNTYIEKKSTLIINVMNGYVSKSSSFNEIPLSFHIYGQFFSDKHLISISV